MLNDRADLSRHNSESFRMRTVPTGVVPCSAVRYYRYLTGMT